MLPLESVPNVSEGRQAGVVASLGRAFTGAGARLLDTHVDPDHHRSVFTLLGDEAALEDGLVTGITEARGAIDLGRHEGVHPRVGAVDVVPLVPLVRSDLTRAESVARAVARRLGEELGVTVFLYGTLVEGRRPAFYRRGGPVALQERVDAGELVPAHGPARLDPAFGAVLVGARAPLLAYNLELEGPLEVAREVAAAVRESGGGLRGVQALALRLADGTDPGLDERRRSRRDRAARARRAHRRGGRGAWRARGGGRARRPRPGGKRCRGGPRGGRARASRRGRLADGAPPWRRLPRRFGSRTSSRIACSSGTSGAGRHRGRCDGDDVGTKAAPTLTRPAIA